jgi:hypothetical protein
MSALGSMPESVPSNALLPGSSVKEHPGDFATHADKKVLVGAASALASWH